MLYLLLYPLHAQIPAFNVLRYETFRSVLAGLVALALSLASGPQLIARFRQAHLGQTIRDVVPEGHQKKAGTPTMGGLLILSSTIAVTLLLANTFNVYIWLILFVTTSFGVVGFLDDYYKLQRGKGLGLTPTQKMIALVVLAFSASLVLFGPLHFDTHVNVPFLKNIHWNIHWYGYVLLTTFVLIACANTVNFTDGLDGLAIGPIMTVSFTYWVFSYVAGNLKFASYLQVPHVVGAGEVSIFCAALIASSLGFLWFNAYPASMIMGDVGALSLGGALGMVAVLAKQELTLPIAGGVFVIEGASVLIQRYYFKWTGGKRFFKMAPLHHHFELSGWPETQVVVRFWIISIICALVALSTLKLR